MRQVFVITENAGFAKSVARYFQFTKGIQAKSLCLRRRLYEEPGWVSQTFNTIADWIEISARQDEDELSLRNSIVILDFYDDSDNAISFLEELNPMTVSKGYWTTVAAMLVLSFPEVHWVFMTPYMFRSPDMVATGDGPAEDQQTINREMQPGGSARHEIKYPGLVHKLSATNSLSNISSLHSDGFTPLFDSTGLRYLICHNIAEGKETEQDPAASYIPLRQELAAAIDDEADYAYLNAYTAYRMGFRSQVVSTYNMMKREFGSERDGSNGRRKVSLIFEDLYLNFPDRPHSVRLSNLPTRDSPGHFPGLKEAGYRIFVTVGHERSAYPETAEINRSYLQDLRARGCEIEVLHKPFSGVFDLWKASGLKRLLRDNQGKAPYFNWPPQYSRNVESLSHSAPGRLLVIADRLVQRAQRILDKVKSVPDAVQGAVLALNAQEYLGHRTPTTSLEALARKHQFEVLAECMFYGVQYHMDVKSRFREIESDVKSISEWFRPRIRKVSGLSAQIRIISELMQLFRDHNQFDEEQASLARIRHLHRHLWFKKNSVYTIIYPIQWYIEFLLVSRVRFVIAIGFWILLLGLGFNLLRDFNPPAWHGYVDAMTSFFGLQPPHDLKDTQAEGAVWLSMVTIVLGYIHLGIFISHLYSVIARR